MLVPVLLFILGLIMLIKGGDWFVDGAVSVAHRFHLPELLIGATVVSIGTTLPEVMVSATSAVSGHGEIAYGNAIGSVICNTALIAAITVAVRPGKVERRSLAMPVAFFFLAAALYSAVAYTTGEFTRPIGIGLLLIFAAYIFITVRSALGERKSGRCEAGAELQEPSLASPVQESDKNTDGEPSVARAVIMLVAGAALIAVGANLLVTNGTLIASALGVPESVIALTFVALGTSLPELVTAITSLVKGHGSLSLGNVVGANLFNLVLVSGVSVTLSPFAVPCEKTLAGMNASLALDIPLMLLTMAILTVPALAKGKLSRAQGIILLAVYAGFCIFQFVS